MPTTPRETADESIAKLQAWLATHNGDRQAAAAALGVNVHEIRRWERQGHAPQHWVDKMGAAPAKDDLLVQNIASLKRQFPEAADDVIELAARCGGMGPASRLSGIPGPTLYQMAGNKAFTTALQQQRIKQALVTARANPTVELHRQGGRPMTDTLLTEYPTPLQELIKKHGSIMGAARALGYSTPVWMNRFRGENAQEFDAEAQRLVQRALAGEIKPVVPKPQNKPWRPPEELDRGELGIVIVLTPESNVEEVFDAGEALGAKWVFKRKLEDSWLMIARMDDDRMVPFKTLVRLVATEVVTP